MTRAEAIDKLISVRHYCFVHGVLGKRSGDRAKDVPPDDDFRWAFRTLNRLYVDSKHHSNATRGTRSERSGKELGKP